MCALQVGIELEFSGEGINEIGKVAAITGESAPALKEGDVIVRVDPSYFRPAEVETLLGDASKAKEKLGWFPEITLEEMCGEMVQHDLRKAKQLSLLKAHGHDVTNSIENEI
jgi:GDPmannose 4,6-dehydratase